MKTFVVIGLGRFGVAVATELSALGHEVLALDGAEENVQKVADTVTHAVTGDARDPAVLRALGVRNYDCAIVAVGDDVGNSALITLNLKDLGVKQVICKAQSHVHRKVLEKIGADRVADAVAARALYGAPVVVVDFGTATNIEVIDRDGRFRGGVIAPGVQTSANALFTHGAQLPDIALVAPPAVIGTNTVEAIQSGIMLGEADRVDGLVRRIFDQLGYSAKVIATGGLAAVVERYSSTIDEVNTELTLEGLRLIADRAYR